MTNTFKTKKGSILPLMKLKGRDYMMVAHRMVWLADDVDSYSTHVELILNTPEETLAKATVIIYDANAKPIRRAEDYKRESKKDFPDFTEKAVTGSLGRALAQLGFGTAYALQDLDEGERIADAPVEQSTITSVEEAPVIVSAASNDEVDITPPAAPAKSKSEFRRTQVLKEAAKNNGSAKAAPVDDWS